MMAGQAKHGPKGLHTGRQVKWTSQIYWWLRKTSQVFMLIMVLSTNMEEKWQVYLPFVDDEECIPSSTFSNDVFPFVKEIL